MQQADGGTVPKDAKDAKVTRGDTAFAVQLYNLATVPPREAAVLQVAVPDVPARTRRCATRWARPPAGC